MNMGEGKNVPAIEGRITTGNLCLRLLFLSLPLFLNDFYLPLVPRDAEKLNLVLDLIIYIGWQTSVIYFAFMAGWFRFPDLGFDIRRVVRHLLYGIALFVVIFIAFVILLSAAKYLGRVLGISLYHVWYFPVPHWHPLPAFLYVMYLSITAGVYEEIIYRGIVIAQLKRITLSPLVLVLGSACLFTVIHWSNGPQTWAEAFVLGSFWAWLYLRGKTLVPIMTAHFLFDFVTIYGLHELILKRIGIM